MMNQSDQNKLEKFLKKVPSKSLETLSKGLLIAESLPPKKALAKVKAVKKSLKAKKGTKKATEGRGYTPTKR
jgi:hypothetical protein